MKRLLSIVLSVVLVLSYTPVILPQVSAETVDTCEEYLTWEVSGDLVFIEDCDESISGDIVIPATLDGYPVDSISSNAFDNCTGITGVTILEGIRSLSKGAFYGCENLKSVALPDSVMIIGDYAFENCTSLESITIPENVGYIGMQAFSGCSSLLDVYYRGIEEQWNVLYIASGNECLTNAMIHTADQEGEGSSAPTDPSAPTYTEGLYDFYEGVKSGASLQEGLEDIAARYDSGDLNWKYEAKYSGLNLSKTSYSQDVKSLRVISATSWWLAMRIKAPGVDGQYSIKMTHGAGGQGATAGSIYVLPGDTASDDILRTMQKTDAVMTTDWFYGENTTDTIAGRETTTGSVNMKAGEEYIVVFLPIERSAFNGNAFFWLGQLEVSRIGDIVEETDVGAEHNYVEDGAVVINKYETAEAAVAAANGGTVKLLADAAVETVVLKPGVTLDLNGYTLTADVVVAMNGATIIDGEDCTGGGLLKIAKGNMVLAENNSNVIPVWNGVDGYIFTKVTFQQLAKTAGDGAAQYIFLPALSNSAAAELIADGGLDNGIQLKVCLNWNNGQCQQFYTYGDDLVAQVFSSGGKLVFSLTITGISGIEDMTANAIVVTDSGTQAININTAIEAG